MPATPAAESGIVSWVVITPTALTCRVETDNGTGKGNGRELVALGAQFSLPGWSSVHV
jgi:hypothetical protein